MVTELSHFSKFIPVMARQLVRDAKHIVTLSHPNYAKHTDEIERHFSMYQPTAEYGHSLEEINAQTELVILNNVLDFTSESAAYIRDIAAKTNDNAIIYAIIRNTGYWHDIEAAIQGNIPTSVTNGMNFPAIQTLTKEAGLKLLPVVIHRDSSTDYAAFSQKIIHMLPDKEQEAKRILSFASSEYFVVSLVKPQAAYDRMFVQSLTIKPKAAVNDIRIDFPFDAFSTIPHIETNISHANITLCRPDDPRPKVFIWHRPLLSSDDLAKIQKLMDIGYLIVIDWDDWYEHWPAVKNENYLNFKAFHAISTSKQPLAEALSAFNPNVKVFENMLLSIPTYQEPLAREKITLFFGAIGREEEVESLKAPIKQLIDKYEDRLFFHVVHIQSLFDWLPTSHKQFTPLCLYPEYNRLMRESDFCLLPLADTEFNHMKSDLKYIEAARNSSIAIASPTVYTESITHQETGFIFENPHDLCTHIEYCIEHPEEARKVARQAYDYVKKERMLSHHFRKRLNWYQELYAQLPELNRQLVERVPELKLPEHYNKKAS